MHLESFSEELVTSIEVDYCSIDFKGSLISSVSSTLSNWYASRTNETYRISNLSRKSFLKLCSFSHFNIHVYTELLLEVLFEVIKF